MNEVAQKKLELRRLLKRLLLSLAINGVLAACFTVTAHAASVTVDLGSGDGGTSFGILEALLLVTLLAGNIPTLVLLAIYWAVREKRRVRDQIDKMKIDEL